MSKNTPGTGELEESQAKSVEDAGKTPVKTSNWKDANIQRKRLAHGHWTVSETEFTSIHRHHLRTHRSPLASLRRLVANMACPMNHFLWIILFELWFVQHSPNALALSINNS